MNLPLMSPAELDNAVYALIVRELGVANAMRFIARHNQSDGVDYTQERCKWLPQESSEIEKIFIKPDDGFTRLVEKGKRSGRGRQRASKKVVQKASGQKSK